MVTIGSMTLRDFEVPQAIRYGGQQRLAVHHLGDGRRIVEALGHDDIDIEFGGVLTGPDAASRARTLEQLCRTGSQVPLVWDTNRLTVIVQRFTADYASESWINYRLACNVMDTTPATTVPSAGTASHRLALDAAAIAQLDPALAPLMSAISAAAGAVDAYTTGSAANDRLLDLIRAAIAANAADRDVRGSQAIVLGYLTRILNAVTGGGTQ